MSHHSQMEILVGVLVYAILITGSFVIACILTCRTPREALRELRDLIKKGEEDERR